MPKILLVENLARDADRFQSLLAHEDFEIARCNSGVETREVIIPDRKSEFAAAVILWEIPGPPFGFSLLACCREEWPNVPVVIVSGTLDATLATRAFALGANDFLEKPLEAERVKSCLKSLLAKHDLVSPLVDELRRTIVGESPSLMTALRQIAKLIPHLDSRALLIGESGTGKELFARAIHNLGPRADNPWVAVNVAAIPATLIESALFGHEKGSFTGAISRQIGVLEEAGTGTLFLDEIGELEMSLQVKLLRVIQEREFRRIGGKESQRFEARLVCATNRDLISDVKQGKFRQDLYHRIAEKTIQIPPLRERKSDVDILLRHFLDIYRDGRSVKFARESLTILRSYPFSGNIRELENLVKAALIDCDGEEILPHHLELTSMGSFLKSEEEGVPACSSSPTADNSAIPPHQELLAEVAKSLPPNWLDLAYREAFQPFEQAFDRIYLRHRYDRLRGNITRAAQISGIDTKTFRKRWRDSGLPSLVATEEETAE